MKNILVTLSFLLVSILSCFGQQKVTNPIFLGPILVDCPSVDAMVDLCGMYDLEELQSEDNYRMFKNGDGSIIKFNMVSDSTGCEIPYVEIRTSQNKKDIEKTILEVGYKRENDRYIKGTRHARRFTTCLVEGNKTKRVIFTKEKGKY